MRPVRKSLHDTPRHRAWWPLAAGWTAIAASVAVGIAFAMHPKSSEHSGSNSPHLPASLAELLSTPPEGLADIPIARMNLLCAQGLSAEGEPDVGRSLTAIEPWAKRVQSETDRHWYRFRQNPAEYEHSEGFFRMLMLAVVLAEDFGVHYNTQRKVDPANARADDGFFADSRDVFLTGLLSPDRQGTCSSLPVLYVAVGRQLGYPIKLEQVSVLTIDTFAGT